MKRLILVFCTDGNAGKAAAKTLRNDETTAQLRDAATFDGVIEQCDGVLIMPDVAKWPRDRIEAAYPNHVIGHEVPEEAMPKRKPGRPRKDAA
ncbi:hypothetical protein [Bradyrhizobium elkanii]|jgi:hypothetical protein|uniref:hypothetical protein n=1 Tax=Bradyrhizobium elkanii TaxID=29448 RepID=UPI0022262D73|nr:hypothetical protein [Bradyrhizobium elkanii]MCW2228099.1 hypothetical protein [Bradyrhizobium elkanii]